MLICFTLADVGKSLMYNLLKISKNNCYDFDWFRKLTSLASIVQHRKFVCVCILSFSALHQHWYICDRPISSDFIAQPIHWLDSNPNPSVLLLFQMFPEMWCWRSRDIGGKASPSKSVHFHCSHFCSHWLWH